MKTMFLGSLVVALLLGLLVGFVRYVASVQGAVRFDPPLSEDELRRLSELPHQRRRNYWRPGERHSRAVGGFANRSDILFSGMVSPRTVSYRLWEYSRVVWLSVDYYGTIGALSENHP